MPKYGRISTGRKETCTQNLQDVFDDVIYMLPWTDPESGITIHDAAILCGHRGENAQNLAFMMETSQVKWPDSKHNSMPSKGIDAGAYHAEKPHIHWNDFDEMEAFKRLVFMCAEKRGVKLTILSEIPVLSSIPDRFVFTSPIRGTHCLSLVPLLSTCVYQCHGFDS